jgi:hypothetical protein
MANPAHRYSRPPRKPAPKPDGPVTYKCSGCGSRRPVADFYDTPSGFYPHSPLCKECAENFAVSSHILFKADGKRAMERICALLDVHWHEDTYAEALRVPADSLVEKYLIAASLPTGKARGTSYGETMLAVKLPAAPEAAPVTEAAVARWGAGRSPEDYASLEAHYAELKAKCADYDPVQEAQVVSACNAWLNEQRSYIEGDASAAKSFHDIYTKSIQSAQLNLKQMDGGASWGDFVRQVEKFTPADLYLDKGLFRDVDGIGKYFERFILRPMRNFLQNRRDEDPDFSLGDDDEA